MTLSDRYSTASTGRRPGIARGRRPACACLTAFAIGIFLGLTARAADEDTRLAGNWPGFLTGGAFAAIATSGSIAYLGDRDEGFKVLDVADPYHPVPAGGYPTPGNALDVPISGDYPS